MEQRGEVDALWKSHRFSSGCSVNKSVSGTSGPLVAIKPSSQYHRSWTSAHGNLSQTGVGEASRKCYLILEIPTQDSN